MRVAGEDAEVKVSILVENTARREKLWAEHGLSLLVEVKGRRILFDTGQSGEILIHNSRELGLSLKDIDLVVLSHGHYDHTGGLAETVDFLHILAAPVGKILEYRGCAWANW